MPKGRIVLKTQESPNQNSVLLMGGIESDEQIVTLTRNGL